MLFAMALCVLVLAGPLGAASTARRYYAHEAHEDRYGVIAPWYTGQNGQLDFRVRIAAETLKRYPWGATKRAVARAPEYVYNGKWDVTPGGAIKVLQQTDWNNGDLAQRAANTLNAWERYYRYAGDPAAFTHTAAIADYLVDHCQTSADRGWPRMLISVPTHGVLYGNCALGPGEDIRGNGKIQLDIAAEAGLALVSAYEMTGNQRWYAAAKHWGDLLAANRNRTHGEAPWGRYAANSGGNGMTGVQTGGVAFVLTFFDELIRTGYTGRNGSLLEARQAGQRYLHDVLLPAWAINDTWGRNYWDWEGPVQQGNVSEFNVQYLMSHPDLFPNWRNDVRNILSLFVNHTSADPNSAAETYSGAWAYPESESCCGKSLVYVPMRFAADFAQYAALAHSAWAREMARRQIILATYDASETGWAEDLIFGGAMVYRTWFKIAHPMALRALLGTLAWMPELAPSRENHILHSSSVVKNVVYGKGDVRYSLFDAPPNSMDVLRLAFVPQAVTAGGRALSRREDLAANGYTIRKLADGDVVLAIRRDGCLDVRISGQDPQQVAPWKPGFSFVGNQVRIIARTAPGGGTADVLLDGVEQPAGIDLNTPLALDGQVVYYRNGLPNRYHTLELVPHGASAAFAVQYSAAVGASDYGEAGGPTGAQRWIFGFTGRRDYIDAHGNAWRPGTEFVARTGKAADVVAHTWWTMKRRALLAAPGLTPDPDLYLFGVHWPELIVNVTVGPGVYHVRLKFAETEYHEPGRRLMNISVNGEQKAAAYDVFAAAGGEGRPVDLVFDNIRPRNGLIEIRLTGERGEAMLQALEVTP